MRLHNGLGVQKTKEILHFTKENSHWLCANGLAQKKGSLYVANDAKEEQELRESFQLLHKWGFNVQWRTSDFINAEYHSSSFFDGFYHSDDVVFSPTTFFQRCASLESNLFTNCRVKQIQTKNALQLQTEMGSMTCDILVIANNEQARNLDPFFSDKITPVRSQTIAIPIEQECLPALTQYGYVQWRDIDGHRLISGCRWATPHLEIGEDDDTILSESVGKHLRKLSRAHFNLTNNPAYEWTGIMGFSCDGLPVIGALPGTSDIISCCGFSGQQSSMGFAAGKAVANLIIHGSAPTIPPLFSPSRFMV